MIVLLLLLAGSALFTIQVILLIVVAPGIPGWLGHDFLIYRDAASQWLHDGAFYPAFQLAGPYPVIEKEVLYPPVALILFAPFTVLPEFLWYAIPVGIIAWSVVDAKPSPLGWIVLLILLVFPGVQPVSWSLSIVSNGNPAMWAAAFVALALRWPVFGPFAWLKPTPILLAFGAIGLPSKWWFVGLIALGGLSLLFAPMWPDYLRVLGNARTDGPTWLYALTSLPFMLLPVAARLCLFRDGRTKFPVE